jgi:hypothetical protein
MRDCSATKAAPTLFINPKQNYPMYDFKNLIRTGHA